MTSLELRFEYCSACLSTEPHRITDDTAECLRCTAAARVGEDPTDWGNQTIQDETAHLYMMVEDDIAGAEFAADREIARRQSAERAYLANQY